MYIYCSLQFIMYFLCTCQATERPIVAAALEAAQGKYKASTHIVYTLNTYNVHITLTDQGNTLRVHYVCTKVKHVVHM